MQISPDEISADLRALLAEASLDQIAKYLSDGVLPIVEKYAASIGVPPGGWQEYARSQGLTLAEGFVAPKIVVFLSSAKKTLGVEKDEVVDFACRVALVRYGELLATEDSETARDKAALCLNESLAAFGRQRAVVNALYTLLVTDYTASLREKLNASRIMVLPDSTVWFRPA